MSMYKKSISSWVRPAGGPLVLLPKHLLNDWQGTDKLNSQSTSDYERSCSINNYLGTLYVRDEQIVVLGDEPMQTAWISNIGFQGGCLIRWKYAPDYQTVTRHCMELDYTVLPRPESFISLTDKRLFLFDAAYPGREINKFPEDILEISLKETGEYGIGIFHFKPSKSVWLIMHKLEKVS